jgi:hypothetical protein
MRAEGKGVKSPGASDPCNVGFPKESNDAHTITVNLENRARGGRWRRLV